jgi:hypothetical protein
MNDYNKQTSKNWIDIQNKIFNNEIPDSKNWDSKTDIVNILNLIGRVKDSNHMLFPQSGGLDLEGAKNSFEKGCIELDFDYAKIVKPIRLLFQSFKGYPEWNYFWLETGELLPSGVYENEGEIFETEEVLERSLGDYVSISYWDNIDSDDEEASQRGRIVIRASKGTYLIVQKTGPYEDLNDYSGDHNNMNAEEFKAFIIKNIH